MFFQSSMSSWRKKQDWEPHCQKETPSTEIAKLVSTALCCETQQEAQNPVSMSSTKRKYLHANQTVPAFTSSPESTPKTNFLRGSNKPRGMLCGFMKKQIETYRNILKHIEAYRNILKRTHEKMGLPELHLCSKECLDGRCVSPAVNIMHVLYMYVYIYIYIRCIRLAQGLWWRWWIHESSFLYLPSSSFHASLVFPFFFPCFPVCVDILFLLSFRFLPFPAFPSVLLSSPSFRMTCICCFENIQT